MTNMTFRSVTDAFQDAWQLRWPFLLSRMVFGFVVLALLAPLTTLALRVAIELSGRPALSDFDIAMFLLSPVGFVAALIVASLALTTAVLNIAFMMAIALHARRTGERRFEEGVARILPRFPAILGFAWRFLLRILGLALPFVIFALLVAQRSLTEFDINYYLSAQPPEFLRAVALIGAALAIMAVILLRALTGWALALPLVLFEGVAPAQSFAASREAMQGQRWAFFRAILAWGALSFLLLSTIFAVAGFAANIIVSAIGTDLEALAAGLIVVLAIWSLVNLLATATTNGALANLLMERAGWPGTAGLGSSGRPERNLLRTGLLAGLGGAAILAGLGALDLTGMDGAEDRPVEVIAHRGAAGARPENTMAAFALAIEDKADWIELDVQESAEGEVIVVHDSDFMKLAGNPLKAWEATAEELAQIDIGSWYGPDYASERTPLLRDVLELAKGTGSGVLIELKYYGHDERLEERVAELVEETGMVDHVQVMSLKYDAVRKMKALRPDWSVGLLAAASVGKLWELEADFLAVNMGMANPTLVSRSREAGKPLFVWTVNDPMSMSRMLSLGVSGLITDEPAMAREVIAQRGEIGALERLVLGLASQLGISASDKEYRDGSP